MNNVVEALKQGVSTRKRTIAFCIKNIRNIEDTLLLETIEKILKGEIQ